LGRNNGTTYQGLMTHMNEVELKIENMYIREGGDCLLASKLGCTRVLVIGSPARREEKSGRQKLMRIDFTIETT